MSDIIKLPCGCGTLNGEYVVYSAACKDGCMDNQPIPEYKKGAAGRGGLRSWVLIDDDNHALDFVLTDIDGRQLSELMPYWYPFTGTREDLADTIAHTQEKLWFTIGHRDALYEVWLDLFGEENQAIKSLTHHVDFSTAYRRVMTK